MEPMHFGKRKTSGFWDRYWPVCGAESFTRITSAQQLVNCPACRVYLNGGTMPKSTQELAKEMRDTANKLLAQAADMERKALRENPPEPPRKAGNNFKVNVRFSPGGKLYSFLLLRTELGGQWFTTGSRPEHSVFRNWEALVTWLNGPDVAQHGAILRMIDPTSLITYVGPDRFPSGAKSS